ncbi:MAG: DNA translocase FtsK 4TM domain-containing protein, partial [Bacillota bacterium]
MFKSIPEKVKYEIIGIFFTGMSVFSFMTLMPINTGSVGIFYRKLLLYSIGIGSYLLPILIFIIGIRYLTVRKAIRFTVKFWAIVAVIVFSLTLYHGLMAPAGQELLPNSFPDNAFKFGGVLSGVLVLGLRKLLGIAGSNVLLACLDLAALLLATAWSITDSVAKGKKRLDKTVGGYKLSSRKAAKLPETSQQPPAASRQQRTIFDIEKHTADVVPDGTILIQDQLPFSDEVDSEKAEPKTRRSPKKSNKLELDVPQVAPSQSMYNLPKISLLNARQQVKIKSKETLTDAARLLEDTLLSFGVEARVVHISNGPSVTRFELQP